jgi:hypothetical protein
MKWIIPSLIGFALLAVAFAGLVWALWLSRQPEECQLCHLCGEGGHPHHQWSGLMRKP